MGKKAKGKAGKGRTISKIKRSNQKRNKLIKKGKLKPNSTNPWIAAQVEKGAKGKAKRLGKAKDKPERQPEKDNDQVENVSDHEESDLDELMDTEEAESMAR